MDPILAVAELGPLPCPPILLYSWPEMRVGKALVGGADEGYQCIAFR